MCLASVWSEHLSATLILGGADLGIGGYIAYAGGYIRHKEFRFEPPPPPRAEERHHEYEH